MEMDEMKVRTGFTKTILDKIINKLIAKKIKEGAATVYVQNVEIGHTENSKKYCGTITLDFVIDEEAIKSLIWKI